MSDLSRRIALGSTAVAAYVSTVLVANWATDRYGLVGVGFGLVTTAGTYAAGLALGIRDAVQDLLGRYGVLAAIALGALLSYLVASPAIATASGIAFAVAEMADLAIYTPLRRRGFTRAVLASNAVGAIVDTFLFLQIAGSPLTGQVVAGQLVGKGWATLAFLAVAHAALGARHALPRQPEHG